VVAGDRAHFPEKTRCGAHGGMFVKGDAFRVGCVAVGLRTGFGVLAALPFQGASLALVRSEVSCVLASRPVELTEIRPAGQSKSVFNHH
jgi:hypothetical protein